MATTTSPAAAISQTYREWNNLLVDELFPRGRAGVPVYLGVHEGLLDECGARTGRGGSKEFIAAVRGLCAPERLFARLAGLAGAWLGQAQPDYPPFVGGLGLAVLAAGDMATDDSATQANYYVRLNALLGVESRTRPEAFERTLNLWKLLQEWLRQERRGELVVRGADGARRFVDPVKSQCLVRACDVDGLLPLLRDVEVEAGQLMEPEDVLPAMRAWLLRDGTRSRLALLLGREPEETALYQAAEALCDAVEDYSAKHTLEIRVGPRRRSRASLAIRPNRYPALMWKRAEWLLRLSASQDSAEPECLVAVGERVLIAQLDAREPATYDTTISMEEAAQLLLRQLVVADEDGNDVTPATSGPFWFQDGSVRGRPGAWDLVDMPAADVPHVVVAFDAAVLNAIKAACEKAPTLVAGTSEVWPGGGLHAACIVTPKAGAVLPGSIAIPARPPLLRLRGGLPIRRRVYLRGGLPSVIADEGAPLLVENVECPGVVCNETCSNSSGMDLPEGRYSLRTNGAAAEVFVVEPRWRECVVHQQAPVDPEVRTALADAELRGAEVAVQRPLYATFFAPGAQFRVYALGMLKGSAPPDGGVYEVSTPQAPNSVVQMKRRPASAPWPLAECFHESADVGTAYSEQQRSAMDRLLEYVSARATGTIESVRAHCVWIAGESASWHSTLSALEDLGHIDVSWEQRRWTVAPACIVPRAVDDGAGLLVGSRARESLAWLKDRGIDARPDSRVLRAGRAIMPTGVVVRLDSVASNEAALRETGIRVMGASPSLAAAPQVRPVTDTSWWVGAEFSPSSRVRRTLQRWNPLQLRWTAYPPEAELTGPALYKWREHGFPVHYVVSGAIRARVRDPAAAKWAIASKERSWLMYEQKARRLLVPSAIGVPRIWRRVLSLASGLTPVREGRLLAFDDIPLDLARAAAVRLNQPRGEGLW